MGLSATTELILMSEITGDGTSHFGLLYQIGRNQLRTGYLAIVQVEGRQTVHVQLEKVNLIPEPFPLTGLLPNCL